MRKKIIYPKDWMALHPYVHPQPSDNYFIDLANRLYAACCESSTAEKSPVLTDALARKVSLYAASYLEDVISGLRLWQTFTSKHRELYGSPLPFYSIDSDYIDDEINEADLCFILWNTLQKGPEKHLLFSNDQPGSKSAPIEETSFVHPFNPLIIQTAHRLYAVLDEAYETAPANELLEDYFSHFISEKEARTKLHWLFGHTYLTQPSVEPYLSQLEEADYYRIPCGPLALFLHEWLDELTKGKTVIWHSYPSLYPSNETTTPTMKAKNQLSYERFTQGNNGHPIVYLNGYNALHRFLTEVLQWPNDPNHTLPQLKPYHDFVLMVHPEKGILLAKDICACISDPLNPYYQPKQAAEDAFRLLTIPTCCPPDLLTYLLENDYLPEARWPESCARQYPVGDAQKMVQDHADFIARHTLLYYYRGD